MLGLNQVYQGDCLEVMKSIDDASVDMILTDPPYGINYKSNRRVVKDKFNRFSGDESLDWLDNFVSESYRMLKNNTSFYLFCSWHYIDVFKAKVDKYFKLKNILVWNKNNHGSGDLRSSYAPKYEFIIYANKGRSIFRYKRMPDVLSFDKIPSSKLLHPTEKNIGMLELFIKNNTDSSGVVLDPFAGSGTTGVACQNLSRNFILIEKEPEYVEICKQRLVENGQES